MVVVLALAALRAGAQTEPKTEPTTTTFPPTKTEFHTNVNGTVPDLTGRWIAVCWLDLPGGQTRTAAMLWEVSAEGGQPQLRNAYAQLPAKQAEEMEKSSQDNKRWEPSPEDMSAIAAAWDGLERMHIRPARLDNYFTGRDAFDDTFKAEPRTKDAQWVLQQTETFDASAAPAVRQVNVFAITETRDGGFRGNYTSTLLAAAPFPIPITFNGTFQLMRLEAPRGGMLTRIGDLFSGCGRR